jgi:hypothetical protein
MSGKGQPSWPPCAAGARSACGRCGNLHHAGRKAAPTPRADGHRIAASARGPAGRDLPPLNVALSEKESLVRQTKGGQEVPRGKKFMAEQIIGKLREAEVGLAQGKTVLEVVRKLGVTEQTYYRWKREYGGLLTDRWRHGLETPSGW